MLASLSLIWNVMRSQWLGIHMVLQQLKVLAIITMRHLGTRDIATLLYMCRGCRDRCFCYVVHPPARRFHPHVGVYHIRGVDQVVGLVRPMPLQAQHTCELQ